MAICKSPTSENTSAKKKEVSEQKEVLSEPSNSVKRRRGYRFIDSDGEKEDDNVTLERNLDFRKVLNKKIKIDTVTQGEVVTTVPTRPSDNSVDIVLALHPPAISVENSQSFPFGRKRSYITTENGQLTLKIVPNSPAKYRPVVYKRLKRTQNGDVSSAKKKNSHSDGEDLDRDSYKNNDEYYKRFKYCTLAEKNKDAREFMEAAYISFKKETRPDLFSSPSSASSKGSVENKITFYEKVTGEKPPLCRKQTAKSLASESFLDKITKNSTDFSENKTKASAPSVEAGLSLIPTCAASNVVENDKSFSAQKAAPVQSDVGIPKFEFSASTEARKIEEKSTAIPSSALHNRFFSNVSENKPAVGSKLRYSFTVPKSTPSTSDQASDVASTSNIVDPPSQSPFTFVQTSTKFSTQAPPTSAALSQPPTTLDQNFAPSTGVTSSFGQNSASLPLVTSTLPQSTSSFTVSPALPVAAAIDKPVPANSFEQPPNPFSQPSSAPAPTSSGQPSNPFGQPSTASPTPNKQSGFTFGQSSSVSTPAPFAQPSNPFGQPSTAAPTPNTQIGSTLVQPSATPIIAPLKEPSNPFGQSSTATTGAFGQPASTFSFGQPSTTSTLAQPSTTSTFGQPSSTFTFGQPATTSPFGQPSSTSTFGQPTTTSTLGQPSSTSTFGQPSSTSSFGQQSSSSFSFGQPSATSFQTPSMPVSSGFGQSNTSNSNALGESASSNTFGQPTNVFGTSSASTPFSFGQPLNQTTGPTNSFGQSTTANTFGQSTAANTFGQPSNTFGQSTPSNTFGQSAPSNTFG
ncbi:hypothetical protein HDU92_007784, partial [Lobulomyces angularis]